MVKEEKGGIDQFNESALGKSLSENLQEVASYRAA